MISEIDIKDWDIQSPDAKKLYEIPRNSIVSVGKLTDPFVFNHVDGMYSHCQALTGEVFHLAAWTEVYAWEKK